MLDIIPNGPGQRRLIGKIAIGQGLAYGIIWWLDAPLTRSYQSQAAIMPIWAWAALLLSMGIAFILTSGKYRRKMVGRLVAVLMLGVQVWFATTFAMAGALTAVGQYIPIAVVVFGEAVFVPGGE